VSARIWIPTPYCYGVDIFGRERDATIYELDLTALKVVLAEPVPFLLRWLHEASMEATLLPVFLGYETRNEECMITSNAASAASWDVL
jgi:hypothetical protein